MAELQFLQKAGRVVSLGKRHLSNGFNGAEGLATCKEQRGKGLRIEAAGMFKEQFQGRTRQSG